MKLSEALRLGEFAVRPYHGSWFERDSHGGICGACAVGRVCIALGYIPAQDSSLDPSEQFELECHEISKLFAEKWPWTLTFYRVTAVIDNPVADCISEMYEYGEKSIQEIADWVAAIEPQETAHDLQPEPNQDILNLSHS